jgi:hypothetical protein
MPNRVIKSTAYASSRTLNDALSSLFVLELFAPSNRIYLISPWITDFTLLDNRFGQFRTLLPEYNGQVRLSVILNTLAEQGTTIYVLSRPDTSRDFVARLHPYIQRRVSPDLHEKSLLTDHFYLRGSMNFTYSGLNRNEEHIELSTTPTDIAQASVAAEAFWRGVAA